MKRDNEYNKKQFQMEELQAFVLFLEEGMIARPIAGHPHDGQNRQSQRLAVDLNHVPPDDPGLLHAPEPLRSSRRRQPDPSPQIGKRPMTPW